MVLTPQVSELTLHKTTAEKELNFYLGKLRTIELICQDRETEGGADPTLQRILEILYATDVSSPSTWAFMHTTRDVSHGLSWQDPANWMCISP